MPRLDGLAAARRIRTVQATIGAAQTPLVALTANAAREDRAAALAAGFAEFIVKPFEAEALIATVARLAAPGAPQAARAGEN
jgi:CheY-like chemotaxis protein